MIKVRLYVIFLEKFLVITVSRFFYIVSNFYTLYSKNRNTYNL